MKKIIRPLLRTLWVFLLLLACTKDVGLVTEVEFTLTQRFDNEGFVNTPLITSFTVVPEALLEGYEYFLTYRVDNGEGYFEDEFGERIPEGEKVALGNLSATYRYIGTVEGEHVVSVNAEDNFGFTEETQLSYTLRQVPATWTATSPVTQIELGGSATIELVLAAGANNGNATYERSYRLAPGSGALMEPGSTEALELNTFVDIVPGTYGLIFTPDALGSAELFFDLRDSNGQELSTSLEFEVVEELLLEDNDITAFELPVQTGAATIDTDAHTVSVGVPFGTELNVAPTVLTVSAGATVSPAITVVRDFTTAISYTVTAENGEQQLWSVMVNEALDDAKEITSFVINGVSGVITGTDILVTLATRPPSTLTPTITHTGASIAPGSGEEQDFSVPVEYTVTAADGTQEVYTARVDFGPEPSSENDIVNFMLPGQTGAATIDTDAHTVALEVTFGTALNVAPTTLTVSTDATVNPSITEVRDFNNTVSYTVTAENGDPQEWTVRVTVASDTRSPENDILNFVLPNQSSTALIDAGGRTIEIEIPAGANIEVAPTTVTVSPGATVTPGVGEQQDFNDPVIYTVTAENGDTAEWTVNVVLGDDITPPVITLIGGDVSLTIGQAYNEQGATALDDIEGDISGDIVIDASGVDTNVAGNYEVTYNVMDSSGNAATQVVRQVTVSNAPDTSPPVITLIGGNVSLTVGQAYNELGATATDNADGNISANIIIDASGVDTNVVGSYQVTYNVMDAAGNAATEVVRQVTVSNAPDTTPPVIALIGGNVSLTVGQAYNELGATATDNVDGNISGAIVIDASGVNTNVAGTYQVTYNVMDAAGNAATQVVRQVTVTAAPDTTPPVITLIGGNVSLTVGQAYNELGATATDNVDGNISGDIVIDASAVNTNVAGTYQVTYNVMDAAGNAATQVVRQVTVSNAPDTTPPVITLIGGNVSLTVGQAYNELGATATDNVDGNISGDIVIDASAVNTNVAGVYQVTYNVMDAAGNAATQVVRQVTVTTAPDTTPPVITLVGGNLALTVGQAYVEPGFTATDNVDGDITASVIVEGSLDTNTPGIYTIRYNVSDAAGNAATQVTRQITVSSAPDTTPPVINLIGGNVSLTVGQTYNEQGATATDNVDGNISANIVIDASGININVVGTYQVTYNVSDAAGNAASQVIRQVTVTTAPDTTPPVISLIGGNVSLTVGQAYTELGATATDNVDGDISASIAINSSSVNTNVVGTYQVTYNVSDAAGNAATQVVRQVTVTAAPDTTPPVITLIGGNVSLTVGQTYTELGATATDNVDGDISTSIAINSSNVNTNVVGTYQVTYNVSDAAGNAATQVVRQVTVTAAPDTTPPVITLIGGNVSLTVGQTYTELGATATDNVDGDISASIAINSSNVNTNVIGTYQVTYNVLDAAGNAATQVIRQVTVGAAPDTTPPVITLIGGNITLTVGEDYNELGATATDNVDGDISGSIMINISDLNTNVAGTYQVTYNVSDAAGNAAIEVIRQVTVNPPANVPPVALPTANITNGDAPLTVNFNGSGSSDSDGMVVSYLWNFDDAGNSNVSVNPSYTFNNPGVYDVSLIVTDDDGANSTAVIITITVNTPNALPTGIIGSTPGTNTVRNFTGVNSTDSDGTIVAYRWNFGDGSNTVTNAPTSTVSHEYTAPGNYTVTLVVEDNDGGLSPVTSQSTLLVTVDAPQPPSFTFSIDPIPEPAGGFDPSALVPITFRIIPNQAAQDLGVTFQMSYSETTFGTITGLTYNGTQRPPLTNFPAIEGVSSGTYEGPGIPCEPITLQFTVTSSIGSLSPITRNIFINFSSGGQPCP